MLFKKQYLLFSLLFLFNFHFLCQEVKVDSLCCACYKYDLEEINKVIKFKGLIKDIEPKYMQHTISLSESENLIQFEKYHYLLKLDKFLKFEISKKLFVLEKASDSISLKSKLELEFLTEILNEKTKVLNAKINSCKQIESIKEYIVKKKVILSLDPNYFSNYVNIINSTIDEDKLNYEELVKLETNLLTKLEGRKDVLENREKLSNQEKSDLTVITILVNETKEKLQKINISKDIVKINPEKTTEDTKIIVPKEYFLKELIMNYDTIQFMKGNQEKIIVANNTMYVFRNDSLIETIKNEDQKEYASIFDNRKPISIDNYQGLFYTVQIGTYSKEVSTRDLKVISNIFYKVLENGKIRYSYGMFNDLQEVEHAKETLKSIGVTDIAVIAYHKTERITIKQAKKIKAGLKE